MNLAHQIIHTFEQSQQKSPELLMIEGNKIKKKTDKELIIDKVLSSIDRNEWLLKRALLTNIEKHPLYIEPPVDVSESYRFGWNRGLAFKIETLIRGRWNAWFNILNKGHFEAADDIPGCEFSMFDGKDEVNKMLENCMSHVYAEGSRVGDFLDFIGYSLGIAWFDKPKISNRLWEKLYNEFDLSLMLIHPSDYLSGFLCNHGASGIAGYYPTPLNVCSAISRMLNIDSTGSKNASTLEPCLGAGAMLLTNDSLCLVGSDINPTMVKASCIQAFLYIPWLLYTPDPIIGLHYSEEEQRINKFFEFNSDSRVYLGNALMGEFSVPENIFEENSKTIEVYLNALDLEKREVFQYEEIMMTTPWHELSKEMKWKITIAQSRELGFDVVTSNPPFGKLDRYTLEQIRVIEARNKQFLKKRKENLARLQVLPHPIFEQIEKDIELRLNEATGQY
ncbi:hypothetical protein ACFPOG_12980 [Paenibacillus aestuarii]|uniref:DNA methylase adenine-specific domain-containing protein n=1 Tax=Paenibacillus aestuarii TaxID=516965 RepID=A0ABW0K6Y6_9BACL